MGHHQNSSHTNPSYFFSFLVLVAPLSLASSFLPSHYICVHAILAPARRSFLPATSSCFSTDTVFLVNY